MFVDSEEMVVKTCLTWRWRALIVFFQGKKPHGRHINRFFETGRFFNRKPADFYLFWRIFGTNLQKTENLFKWEQIASEWWFGLRCTCVSTWMYVFWLEKSINDVAAEIGRFSQHSVHKQAGFDDVKSVKHMVFDQNVCRFVRNSRKNMFDAAMESFDRVLPRKKTHVHHNKTFSK